MDSERQTSVHGSSEHIQQDKRQQQQEQQQIHRDFPPTRSEQDTTTNSKSEIPSFSNQPHAVSINNIKNIPSVEPPHFIIPPLPSTLPRRRSASPDRGTTPNPARQIFSYPVSHPQDAPKDYTMSQKDDGPPPPQRRKLSSPENRPRSLRSDEEPESRRGSAGKSTYAYDPVHEHHDQSSQSLHSRRPSSAQSQHSHMSSYSGHSSILEGDEPSSPLTGDQPVSRDGKKRKHKCQECGQYFTRLHNLKSHLLTHSQEKPFVCKECGHKFRRLHDLKRHHKLHTGERPYTCPGCNRSFARMDALNRHRKPGGECSLHNISTGQQNAVDRRMSLPPGFGRPSSSQGSTSPMPQSTYLTTEPNINPALATASHGHSYPPTHLPPKQKHLYQRRESGDPSPGLLAPPPPGTGGFARTPPPSFAPSGNGRGVQPPPLVIPNAATLSPIHTHHYSAGTGTGSSSSGGRSAVPADARSPIPPIMRGEEQPAPSYSLTESPRGMTPPPLQPPPLSVPPSTLPLLPSPGTLISPSSRNSYDRSARQSIDANRGSDGSRGYFDLLIERNRTLEERVKQLEHFVYILWQERRQPSSLPSQPPDSSRPPS